MSVAEEEVEEVPSPFVEGTWVQWAWDATSLEWLKRCPRYYQYKIEGWNPTEENVHLRWGQEYHRAMHDYDILRHDELNHEDALFELVKEVLWRIQDWDPDHKYKNRSTLIRSIIGYLDQHQNDPAETFIDATGKPAVEYRFEFQLDYGPTEDKFYTLCGYLDKVVTFNGDRFIKDYKSTTSTPSDYYWRQFDPNNQMTLYTLAGQVAFQVPVKGVIIDSAQIMIDSTRFTRGITYRTQEQLDEWLVDLKYWLEKAQEYAQDGYWPMNDTACDKYGGCKFREICSKSPDSREIFLKSNFTKEEPWNPLKPR